MGKNTISLTGSHGLKSGRQHDYSRNIRDTTHHSFHFTEYRQGKYRQEWTGRGWDCVLSTEELFAILELHLVETLEDVNYD